jgi:hypothetical protein
MNRNGFSALVKALLTVGVVGEETVVDLGATGGSKGSAGSAPSPAGGRRNPPSMDSRREAAWVRAALTALFNAVDSIGIGAVVPADMALALLPFCGGSKSEKIAAAFHLLASHSEAPGAAGSSAAARANAKVVPDASQHTSRANAKVVPAAPPRPTNPIACTVAAHRSHPHERIA